MTFTHRFLPTTLEDKKQLMAECGVQTIEDLLIGIPKEIQFKNTLNLGRPLSEQEIRKKLHTYMQNSRHSRNALSFVGAGVYEHYSPAVINQILLRGEFLTSYTPYQAEMSQGTLQAMFEFQTMIARMFEMEVSNASHYDGSTSLAEAALMAMRLRPKSKRILVSAGIHPEYVEVLRSYLEALNVELSFVPLAETGQTDRKILANQIAEDVAIVLIQSPNFYGVIEDIKQLCDTTKKNNVLFGVSVTEPLSLAVLQTPGEVGADIATAEGQSLGLPQSFGGPYIGLFTTRKEFVRQIPGRLCGETQDAQGRRSYTLTLNTREQHIRRDKATSNICTNQNLCALWVSIWLSLVGKKGFYELATHNLSKSEYAKTKLTLNHKVKLRYPHALNFNEFTLDLPYSAEEFVKKSLMYNVMPGVPLSRFYKQDKTGLLISVTEMKSKEDIDKLYEILKEGVT